MERNEIFHVEFEVVRLKDSFEDELNFTSQDEHRNQLKLGTYILIKKEFKREMTFTDLQLFSIKDTAKLYYRQLLIISQNYKNEIDLRFFDDSRYHLPGWSAKYEGIWLGKNQVKNQLVFGDSGPYKIEEQLQDKGLGLYMIDSLILWGKQNYGDASAKISIGFPNDSDENKKRLEHFYGKRNLRTGIQIKETTTHLENSNKFELITCENFIKNLLISQAKNENLVSNYKHSYLDLDKVCSSFLNREKYYWLSLGVLIILVLILKFQAQR